MHASMEVPCAEIDLQLAPSIVSIACTAAVVWGDELRRAVAHVLVLVPTDLCSGLCVCLLAGWGCW